jgi:hypothetical protein
MALADVRLGHCTVTLGTTDLGHTKGGVEITIKNDVTETTVDKYGSTPAKAWHKGTRVEVKVVLAEYTNALLKEVLNGAAMSGANMTFGSNAGAKLTGAALTLHPIEAADDDDTLDVEIFSVVVIGDVKLAYKVDEETVHEVTFLGLVSEDDADEDGKGFLARFGTPSLS